MGQNTKNYFEQPSAGSTDNKLVLGGSAEDQNGNDLKSVFVTAKIADISTAGQTYVPSPITGKLKKVTGVLNGAITGANSVLTVKAPDGTVGTITVAHSGSAAGDVDSLDCENNNSVEKGELVEIETDGGSTNTVVEDLLLEFAPE